MSNRSSDINPEDLGDADGEGGKPQEGKCFDCSVPLGSDAYCFGCKSSICGDCDTYGLEIPFGSHGREDHVESPEARDEDWEDEDEDEEEDVG